MHVFHCIRGLIVGSLLASVAAAAEVAPPKGYQLVWADEFNEDGPPSEDHWRYEHGFVRNQELQWYQPDNARCEGGLLVIEARREKVANPRFRPESRRWNRQRQFSEYTSSSLKTQGLHDWQYGMFEIRARIDARPGLWPAIWTLGVRGGWPANGEIDIMEYYDDSILANACWAARRGRSPVWDSSKTKVATLGEDWAKQFHVWRMWWDESSIRLMVDDRMLNTIELAKVDEDTGADRNPFRQPHYLMLNLAIGGTRGGDPAGTEFPAKFKVDYVRVFQRSSNEAGSASPDPAGER